MSKKYPALELQRHGLRAWGKKVWQIYLDEENTFDLIPYLDVVNKLLEKKANFDLDQENNLATKVYPFNLPLNWHHEKAKLFYETLNVAKEEL